VQKIYIKHITGQAWRLKPVFLASQKIRRMVVQGQTSQKVYRTLISINGWVWWGVSVTPAMWGSTNKRMEVQVAQV
jgi:hypothetical protein